MLDFERKKKKKTNFREDFQKLKIYVSKRIDFLKSKVEKNEIMRRWRLRFPFINDEVRILFFIFFPIIVVLGFLSFSSIFKFLYDKNLIIRENKKQIRIEENLRMQAEEEKNIKFALEAYINKHTKLVTRVRFDHEMKKQKNRLRPQEFTTFTPYIECVEDPKYRKAVNENKVIVIKEEPGVYTVIHEDEKEEYLEYKKQKKWYMRLWRFIN